MLETPTETAEEERKQELEEGQATSSVTALLGVIIGITIIAAMVKIGVPFLRKLQEAKMQEVSASGGADGSASGGADGEAVVSKENGEWNISLETLLLVGLSLYVLVYSRL